jgi:ATP/maltotriose-dependent transcriptional regulator MalT
MLRLSLTVVLLTAKLLAQSAEQSLDDRLAGASRLLEQGQTAEAERLLRQLIPKPEEDRLQDFAIFTPAGVHDILWATVGYSYLGANDYANATRVAGERLRAADAKGDAGTAHVPIFLSLMAEIERLQGHYAAAFPMYQRLYQLWLNDRLPADFQKGAERGYLECLIVRGEAATADTASRPAVNPDGSEVGPSFHEDTFNTHAVAMEQAGHLTEASQFEAKFDAESRRPPAANQQDRDLFRARLMSAREQEASAEEIYRKWKTANLPAGMDPKESLQIRTVALRVYSHFLSVQGRVREAQAIQSQLTALGCGPECAISYDDDFQRAGHGGV